MSCYLESSAFLKLVVDERESGALLAYLDEVGEDAVISSWLLVTEAHRAISRLGLDSHGDVDLLLTGVSLIRVLDEICTEAGALLSGHPMRTLDAVHVATALCVDADIMLSYDSRQLDAAGIAGLETASPR